LSDVVLIFVVRVSAPWLMFESLVGGAVIQWIGSSANGLAEAQGCVVCVKHGVSVIVFLYNGMCNQAFPLLQFCVLLNLGL
jgi:hypothetical protein